VAQDRAGAAAQAAILTAPIDPEVLDVIYRRVRLKLGGKGVFVRSSTNAEDLPGFNGAGLYDTVPNVLGKEALGVALKTVWASLWNLRAVEERTTFGIDHRQVFAAVLVQVGGRPPRRACWCRPTCTTARRRRLHHQRQVGPRHAVVEGQKVPEQIIFDATNDGTKIISRADDPTMLVFEEGGGIREVPVAGTAASS
jgi:phosphoenolpyruvate synthase/pyruvate phosphate dikinase